MQLFQRILTKEEINRRFIRATISILAKGLVHNKAELAESLGVKPAKFSEILNGRMKVGVDMIAIMCDFYKVSPDWLLMSRGDNVFRETPMKKIWIDDEDLKSIYPDDDDIVETPKKEVHQDPSLFLDLIREKDTVIREQAEEIGRLREKIKQFEQIKNASTAHTEHTANVG